jgi:hypothetical protein
MRTRFEITASSDSDSDGTAELISLASLKLELGITGTTDDALLTSRIDRESQLIAEECDRRFAFASAVETFIFGPDEQSPAGGGLSLRLYPIYAIESVTIGGAALADDDFFCEDDNGLLFRAALGIWSGTVVVTYSGGYQLPDDAPARLAQACIEAIRVKRSAATRDPGISSLSHGDMRVSYFQESTAASSDSSGGLPQSVLNLIKPYRRLSAY